MKHERPGRRPAAIRWLAGGLLMAWTFAHPGAAAGREIGPDADLCAEMNSLDPGGELVLRPGTYQGPCRIRRGGAEGAPIVIRALDLAHRPRIAYQGEEANVLEVAADHVVIRGLAFGPTKADIDGVRILASRGVVVEECAFAEMGGIAVVANYASGQDLVVRRNTIRNSRSTALYFGCHDGASCAITGLVIERNYIHGVTAPPRAIGYGIQVKLNSVADILDNIVVETRGPGIMVYGASSPDQVSVVERNFTMRSMGSAGIVVGGGPVVVRNNVVMGHTGAGIGLEDYGGRGLLRGVTVAHNTVYRNGGSGVSIGRGVRDGAIVNNAIHTRAGTAAVPNPRSGLRVVGNIDCSQGGCFTNPEDLDFSPIPGGRLFRVLNDPEDGWRPVDDFFGVTRGPLAMIGAIERSPGVIRFGLKR